MSDIYDWQLILESVGYHNAVTLNAIQELVEPVRRTTEAYYKASGISESLKVASAVQQQLNSMAETISQVTAFSSTAQAILDSYKPILDKHFLLAAPGIFSPTPEQSTDRIADISLEILEECENVAPNVDFEPTKETVATYKKEKKNLSLDNWIAIITLIITIVSLILSQLPDKQEIEFRNKVVSGINELIEIENERLEIESKLLEGSDSTSD